MKQDLKRLLPWLTIPLVLAALAWFRPGLFFGSGLEDREAPTFDAVIEAGDGQGDRVSLADQRGRVVVLDFWASWCGPCRQSVPILNRVAARFRDKPVSIYGVNVEPELGPRRLLLAHQGIGAIFPTFQDKNGDLQRDYGVQMLPTLVVIDPEGKVRHVSSGVPFEGRLVSVVDGLLP
ncbi:MAG: TlpA disulfide reductase family protein [Polyangiales bacterium]